MSQDVNINVPGPQISGDGAALVALTTKRRGAIERGDKAEVEHLTKAIESIGFTCEDIGKRTTKLHPKKK
jgi:hypothetical protein